MKTYSVENLEELEALIVATIDPNIFLEKYDMGTMRLNFSKNKLTIKVDIDNLPSMSYYNLDEIEKLLEKWSKDINMASIDDNGYLIKKTDSTWVIDYRKVSNQFWERMDKASELYLDSSSSNLDYPLCSDNYREKIEQVLNKIKISKRVEIIAI